MLATPAMPLHRAAPQAHGGASATASWDNVMAMGSDAMAHVVASGGSLGKLERSLLRDVQADDEAMIMFTSGSTGKPKGVVHTQRSLGTAVKLAEMAGVATGENDGTSVQLMAVPLFHITALYGIGLLSIPNGIKVIMMRKWDAGAAVEIVEKEKVTRISGVPTMMRDLLEHPRFDPKRCSSLKSIIAGGAPVPPAQVETMRKKAKGVNSGQGYGMTESMGLGTINRGADYLKRPTSCGLARMCAVRVGWRGCALCVRCACCTCTACDACAVYSLHMRQERRFLLAWVLIGRRFRVAAVMPVICVQAASRFR